MNAGKTTHLLVLPVLLLGITRCTDVDRTASSGTPGAGLARFLVDAPKIPLPFLEVFAVARRSDARTLVLGVDAKGAERALVVTSTGTPEAAYGGAAGFLLAGQTRGFGLHRCSSGIVALASKPGETPALVALRFDLSSVSEGSEHAAPAGAVTSVSCAASGAELWIGNANRVEGGDWTLLARRHVAATNVFQWVQPTSAVGYASGPHVAATDEALLVAYSKTLRCESNLCGQSEAKLARVPYAGSSTAAVTVLAADPGTLEIERLVVQGNDAYLFAQESRGFGIRRFDATSLGADTSFGAEGFVALNGLATDTLRVHHQAVVDEHGRVVVCGLLSKNKSLQIALWRLDRNGRTDAAFGASGYHRLLEFEQERVGRCDALEASGGVVTAIVSVRPSVLPDPREARLFVTPNP